MVDGLICRSCQTRYPSVGQTVCFLDTETAHPSDGIPDSLLVKIKNWLKRYPQFYNILVYIFGASNAGVSPKAFLDKYVTTGQIVVNLGAGPQKRRPNTLQVDMFAFPEIDVAADLEKLPFKGGSIHAVFCTSVLEHVIDSKAVLVEIRRILKPGGFCYLTVPFMYPFHSSPHDYMRWTLQGLESFVEKSGFKKIDSGLRHGPTTALILIFVDWVAAILSFGSVRIFETISILGMAILAPFAHIFDFWLNRLKVSRNIASGFYYIGEKKD